jgi:hypothetical protein
VIREAIHEDVTEAPEAGATKALPETTSKDQPSSANTLPSADDNTSGSPT